MKRERVYDGFVKVEVVETPAGKREVIVATNSVAFLVYNRTREEVLLVEQDRVPLMSDENPTGRIVTTAAERLDKPDKSVIEHVLEGLTEELGITGVTCRDVYLLNKGEPLAMCSGILTECQYLAYVEVDESQIDPTDRIYGNKAEGERIHRVFVPINDLEAMQFRSLGTFALVQWFLRTTGR